MSVKKPSTPLIRTKLHRPPVSDDHLHREHLLNRLNQRRYRPLTLVSAPAGYGKSTLVSCWLEANEAPSTWLSLDEYDNDLHLFLSYLVQAIQNIFPGAVNETQAMLNAPESPPMIVLSRSLINELDQIEKAFILVLDDYHLIHDKGVHDLVATLLKLPPAPMHLVMVTRRDPALPLTSLRSRGQMTEIRTQDLRFSLEDSGAFLEKCMGISLDRTRVSVLDKKTEGWVTGLRLAALTLRNQTDKDRFLENLPEDNRYVMDYILSEVLSQQAPAMQENMLATSILNRFCAPLCEAVSIPSAMPDNGKMNGQEFIDRLERYNLFSIPMDDENRWYRYHHLFQSLLQRLLKDRCSQDNINTLHIQASVWYAENGLIEEALEHALKGGDTGAAERLVAQHRHHLMNQEKWHQLARWLGLFPAENVEQHSELLLLRAWLSYCHWYSLGAMAHDLELVEGLAPETTDTSQIISEVGALKSGLLYWATDSSAAVNEAQQTMDTEPIKHECVRSMALFHMGGAYQMAGSPDKTEKVLWEALQGAAFQYPSSNARILNSLCFVYWCEADLRRTRQTAAQFLKLSEEHNLTASTAFACYFLGIVHYDRNELDAAVEQLGPVVENPYLYPMQNVVHSAFALSLARQAQGRLEEAREILQSVVNLALERRNNLFRQTADAFQAQLDLRQGRIAEAELWSHQFSVDELQSLHRFFVPALTWIKVLLTCGTKDGLQKADTLLKRFYDFVLRIHHSKFLIDVLALQAMLHDARGDEKAAFYNLTESLALAEPGGFIRPFLDLGPNMFDLLNRLAKRKTEVNYISKLLTAFRNERIADEPPKDVKPYAGHGVQRAPFDVIDTMTKRELEITALLAQRLSNKEIAEKLFISPETVKRHVYNIYQKLHVSTRREAAKKATALGII